MMAGKTKRRIIAFLAVLYAATWLGGWITYSTDTKARARQTYANAQKRDREMADFYQREGLKAYDTSDHLFKEVPRAGVSWCVPLLPGVLLADSGYSIGPLWGRGGVYIVLYYGVGTVEIFWLAGWIS
jgi:hypothetical protein